MRKALDPYLSSIGLLAGLAVIVVSGLMLATIPQKASAAAQVCHAAMVLDRSGSVDDEQLETMRQQVLRLFQPGGIFSDRVELAFWSFSSNFTSNTNYDAPFNPFVSSKGVNSSFQTNLYRMQSGGGTDYEQGLGYDGYVFNRQTMNTRDGINNVINQANIIVLMTDGQPNTPGAGGDNNPVARGAARSAVLKHKAAGKLVVGGIIQGMNQSGLNYVINGSDTDPKDIFNFSQDYTTLTRQLTDIIRDQCDKILPPPSANAYSLTPTVTSNNTVVSGTDAATFSYNVNNSATSGQSNSTGWSVKRVLVDRGQSASKLFYSNPPYRDGWSCDKLLTDINRRGTCTEVASGQRAFAPGNTSLDNDAAGATNVVLDDSWPVGTKVCYVLTLKEPTQDFNPSDRFSKAACLTIGKRPLLQIHGGDLRVGRHFITDDPVPVGQNSPEPAHVGTSVTPKGDGHTYGSWGEYAVYSPGLVVGFATLSGLEGGYESTLPNTQEFWSKLTFANTDNEYGLFTKDDTGGGTIPNVRDALLTGREVARDLRGVDTINLNGPDIPNGLYEKETGNLNLDASTLEKGKTVIVHVADGTLTITGNIDYANGPYTDISEIPQLILIAKNIVIKESVVHVSAWLIADDKQSGTVSTCDNAATLTVQICNQQLRIDGPVMARHFSLRRTAGAGANGAAGDPAEIINLPADAYLWSQSAGGSDVRANTTFATELPPYF